MLLSTKFLLTAAFINLLTIKSRATSGAHPPAESEKPNFSIIHGIKNSKTVYLNEGEDFYSKVRSCDGAIGSHEYCRIFLNGQPSRSFTIERSNTIVTGHPRVKLYSPSRGPFIKVSNNTHNVLIENLGIHESAASNSATSVIEVSGSNISQIAVRNCHIHGYKSINGSTNERIGAFTFRGIGLNHSDRIQDLVITENTIENVHSSNGNAILLLGNIEKWIVSWNKISNVAGNGIHIIGTFLASLFEHFLTISSVTGGETIYNQTVNRRVLPGRYDQPRIGWIEENYISDITGENSSAINVNGAEKISVEYNEVLNSSVAYEIGAENCVESANISFTGNIAHQSNVTDLILGASSPVGYEEDTTIKCDGRNTTAPIGGHGYMRQVSVSENELNSATQVILRFRVTESIIARSG